MSTRAPLEKPASAPEPARLVRARFAGTHARSAARIATLVARVARIHAAQDGRRKPETTLVAGLFVAGAARGHARAATPVAALLADVACVHAALLAHGDVELTAVALGARDAGGRADAAAGIATGLSGRAPHQPARFRLRHFRWCNARLWRGVELRLAGIGRRRDLSDLRAGVDRGRHDGSHSAGVEPGRRFRPGWRRRRWRYGNRRGRDLRLLNQPEHRRRRPRHIAQRATTISQRTHTADCQGDTAEQHAKKHGRNEPSDDIQGTARLRSGRHVPFRCKFGSVVPRRR